LARRAGREFSARSLEAGTDEWAAGLPIRVLVVTLSFFTGKCG
jgi:hypothetical protein